VAVYTLRLRSDLWRGDPRALFVSMPSGVEHMLDEKASKKGAD